MRLPTMALLGLVVCGVILNSHCDRMGRLASADPQPTVIAPKAVLLRTPDAFGCTSFETSVALSNDGRNVAVGRIESSGTVVSL